MAFYFSFILALFTTMALIPPLIKSASRLKFVDIPDGDRKIHSTAIPRIGGIAMVIGAMVPILMLLTWQDQLSGFLMGILVIFIFGVWDDRKDLDYRAKLFGQTVAVLIVIIVGNVTIDRIPLLGLEPVSNYISYPLTLLFLLGITNAVNLADGLDGLAGGTTLLSLSVIAILGYIVNNLLVVAISVAIIGSILGFLRFNTYPARVFMGDSGSQFLGFSVGVLTVMLTQNEASTLSFALPLIILTLPILDTLMVMTQRISEKRSPFKADKNHIHHKLLALGLDHYESVFVIYVIQASLVLTAYYLRFQSDLLVLSVFVFTCFFIAVLFSLANLNNWHLDKKNKSAVSQIMKIERTWLFNNEQHKFSHYIDLVAIVVFSLFMLTSSLIVTNISYDIVIISAILLVLTIYSGSRNLSSPFSWIEKASIYIACTFVVYLLQSSTDIARTSISIQDVCIIMLGIVVVLGFRYSRKDHFEMTPLDFLVIFIALSVPTLSGSFLNNSVLQESIAKLILLFYVIELILSNVKQKWNVLRLVLCGTLGLIVIRGLF